VTEAFSVYGKATYLFTRLKAEEDGHSDTQDSPGWIGELGVKYAFTKQVGANLGYKYETTKGDDSDVRDTFTGLTLGVNYTFE
jgi:opacity protein-like surface antigen